MMVDIRVISAYDKHHQPSTTHHHTDQSQTKLRSLCVSLYVLYKFKVRQQTLEPNKNLKISVFSTVHAAAAAPLPLSEIRSI